MLAKIGDVVFSARDIPFNHLSRDTKSRWIEHHTVDGKTITVFSGGEASRARISGTLLCDFHAGHAQIEKLHEMAKAGTPQPFSATIGTTGSYLGNWAIVSVNEERSIFTADGQARKIDFCLELMEIAA